MSGKQFTERKARKSFGLPIIISLDSNNIELPARLNDISEGGISFKSNAVFPVNEKLEIVIPYPQMILTNEDFGTLKIKVDIRWSKEYNDENDLLVKYIHGCKFIFQDGLKDLTIDVKRLIKLSEQLGEKPLGF